MQDCNYNPQHVSRHIVIVGNGIAGVTAARFIRKNDSEARITIVSAESRHHLARTALMYVYMGHLNEKDLKPYEDFFWGKNRFELRLDYAVRAEVDAKVIFLASGESLRYDELILATGSRTNRFGWPGQDLAGVQGLVSIQDLRSMMASTMHVRRAIVVGGGLIGIEMVEMLRSRGIDVTFLVREKAYMDYLLAPQESELIHNEIREHGVDLRLGVELEEILGDVDGRVRAVRTADGEVECGFVGLATGVSPNTDLAAASGLDVSRGILVDRSFRTSAPAVYAIGDCAEFREPLEDGRRVEQLWYSGRHHGRELGLMLCGRQQTYSAPIYYNSAKFFDLEYQSYGQVPTTLEASVAWGSEGRFVRVAYEVSSGNIMGINTFGVRVRHEVVAGMIRSGTPLDQFLGRWSETCFDHEFSRSMAPPSDLALKVEVA